MGDHDSNLGPKKKGAGAETSHKKWPSLWLLTLHGTWIPALSWTHPLLSPHLQNKSAGTPPARKATQASSALGMVRVGEAEGELRGRGQRTQHTLT